MDQKQDYSDLMASINQLRPEWDTEFIGRWVDFAYTAAEHLDTKEQWLAFLEDYYMPKVHMYRPEVGLFIADVVWDLIMTETT